MPLQVGTPSRRYLVGGEWFSSKQAVTNRAKSILHKYEPGEVLNKEDFSFIISLLKNHHSAEEKIRDGAILVYVRHNPRFNNLTFYVIRKDGTETDFSYLKCIKPINPLEEFAFCCRNAIVDQILSFRDSVFAGSDQITCPLTGKLITVTETHVHHLQPIFKTLVASFITERQIDISKIEYKRKADGIGDDFANASLKMVWQTYHRIHARLQIISIKAHAEESKRNSKR